MADCREMMALLESGLFIYYYKKQSLVKRRDCVVSNCRQCGATGSDLEKEEDKLTETADLIRSLVPICLRKNRPLCVVCRVTFRQLEEFESTLS